VTGRVVDPESVDAIASTVIELLHGHEVRAAMGAAGAAWIRAAWTWDVMAARLQRLLGEALQA
jgi:phosphatidylinositol alpha-1,6-mannosyltransferase